MLADAGRWLLLDKATISATNEVIISFIDIIYASRRAHIFSRRRVTCHGHDQSELPPHGISTFEIDAIDTYRMS